MNSNNAAAAGSGAAKRRAIARLILALPSIAALLFVACPFITLLNLGSGLPENFNSTGSALIAKDEHSCARSPRSPLVFETFGLNDRNVSDCCCTFESLERVNYEDIRPLLKKIVATPFFSHFKIDLCSECELWRDAPLCVLRDCGVCECEAPPGWASEVEWLPDHAVAGDADGDCGHVDDRIMAAVDSHVTDGWSSDAASMPAFFEGPTSLVGESDAAVVVDLRLNPERYTGYAGSSADKVWEAIHNDNCFREDDAVRVDGTCALTAEQRVYNRIISGMHSSISLHIAHSHCLEMDADRIAECKTWGSNVALARERVLNHPDRLENLYVAFAVMLRAVQKAGPAITAAVPTEDPFLAESLSEWSQSLLPELTKTMETCPATFDEEALFAEGTAVETKSRRIELKQRFSHLLQIMQCVGCDRCKLWGTLQTLGVGTALRIVADGDEDWTTAKLSRQEAVALVHTLERFSSALAYAHGFAKDEPSL
ncbi:hypothetical protein ACHAWF_006706 [Thalassiosira exigua]